MELIKRYIYEVGRRLPKGMRADVEAELHSLLLDAIEARSPGATEETGEVPEEIQVAVLKEFGPPAKVAAQYQPPHRYLIGPQLFEAYCITVTVVVVLNMLLSLLVGISAWVDDGQLWQLWIEMLSSFISSSAAGLGFVTLVFAILERTLPFSEIEENAKTSWDPHTLPDVQGEDRIKRVELLVGMGLIVLVLVLFNVFPDLIAISFMRTVYGETIFHTIPILAPNFATDYLPWLNVIWIGYFVLAFIVIRQGRWQRGTRIFDFALAVMGVLLLGKMIGGPPLLKLDPTALNAGELTSLEDSLLPLLAKLLDAVLVIALLASIGDAAHKLYLVFKKRVVIPVAAFSPDTSK